VRTGSYVFHYSSIAEIMYNYKGNVKSYVVYKTKVNTLLNVGLGLPVSSFLYAKNAG
jgi:hypothetical protein